MGTEVEVDEVLVGSKCFSNCTGTFISKGVVGYSVDLEVKPSSNLRSLGLCSKPLAMALAPTERIPLSAIKNSSLVTYTYPERRGSY